MTTHTELLIIGGGGAGISVACGAWEAGVREILIADRGERPGGVLLQCTHEGFSCGSRMDLTGPETARLLCDRLSRTGAVFLPRTTAVRLLSEHEVLLSGPEGVESVRCSHMVLATGCYELPLPSLGISGTRPCGIYTAGEIQLRLSRGEPVPGSDIVLAGSGDLGVIVAGALAQSGKQVLILEKESVVTALPGNVRRFVEPWNIPVLTDTVLTGTTGENRLHSVLCLQHGQPVEITCDTLITAIGMVPDRLLTDSAPCGTDGVILAGNCHTIYSRLGPLLADAENLGRELGRSYD